MAKQRGKVLPARKTEGARGDDSLLIRSAESFGRVIGSLQRQVQGGAKRVSNMAEGAMEALPELPEFGDVFGGERPPRKTRDTGARKTKTAARKQAASRKTASARKRASARKPAGARKTKTARKSSARKR